MTGKNVNVNRIYSGHALSCTVLSSFSLQACHLNKGKKIFQINVTDVRMPTGRTQTCWRFTKCDRGFELRTTEKQIPLVAGWRP